MKPFDPERFSDRRILVAGDLMIDEYLWGEVERISPEAPVSIVDVNREELMLGGAGNVVRNLASLGAKVAVVGAAGAGRDGNALAGMLEDLGADVRGLVRDPSRPTTRKTRIIAANQHVLRIDRETRTEACEETSRRLARAVELLIPESDLVLISDYGKGILPRPLLSKIAGLCRAHGKTVLADPKGLDFSKYAGVDMVTPNRKEASLASGIEIRDDGTLREAAVRLMAETRSERLLITCGKDGMVLFEDSEPPFRIRTEARQVFDVSGAGDTVLAVMGLALASGASWKEAAGLANVAAGIVVGKVGAAVAAPAELARAVSPDLENMPSKFAPVGDIEDLVAQIRRRGKTVVLTNGCFDLIHAGHVELLARSAAMGDVLVVAIDDDRSVRELKGPGRPVISQQHRIGILCALECVGRVTVFGGPSKLPELLEIVRPDVLTKGANYAGDQVLGREIVERHGGEVRLVPFSGNLSSTAIIDSIRSGGCA